MDNYSVVGKSLKRADAVNKATASLIYGVDVRLPHMLYGKILRSRYPHARILKIDASAAQELPGVKAVITAKDTPTARWGFRFDDMVVWDSEKVRCLGDAVAAVAAIDEKTAERALGLIDVEYEELPAVFDPEEAMKGDAPLVHEALGNYFCQSTQCFPIPGTNVCSHFKLRKGDVEQAFASADIVIEDRFTSHAVQHCHLEPHAAVAAADADGKITVWSNTQAPYWLQGSLSASLQIPANKIRVIVTEVGGGYGGKLLQTVEPFCVLLAMKTRRPVKMVMTRVEEFTASSIRHPAVIDLKVGALKDGTIVAVKGKLVWDTGAYSHAGPIITKGNGHSAAGPYDVPNIWLDSYCVYTNNPVSGAFRGFGVCQTTWAMESLMDELAARVGLDPLEIRLRNALEDGDIGATGGVLESVGIKECLRKAAEGIGWGEPLLPNRGRGIASVHKFTAPNAASAAFLKVNKEGTANVLTSAVEMGQGSKTVLAQIAAEELGIAVADVTISMPDTDVTPHDWGTGSSRITSHMGNAVRKAAADAKAQLLQTAAEMLEAKAEDLEMRQGMVFVAGVPGKALPIIAVAMKRVFETGGPVLGRGSHLGEGIPVLDPETAQGGKASDYFEYGAQAAEVEVDRETGEIKIIKLVAAHDVGFAINPMNCEAQIEGSVVMGIGVTLLEDLRCDRGKVVNPSFEDYGISTAVEVPDITPILVEVPYAEGPFGAKGIGEVAVPPAAPAIANAIYNALKVRVKDLPITPDKILRELEAQDEG